MHPKCPSNQQPHIILFCQWVFLLFFLNRILEFQCSFYFSAGKPEPTIRWFREGKELTDQPDFEISYSNGRVSMTIPEVFDEDGGQYTCSAENIGGIASSTAELIVRGL